MIARQRILIFGATALCVVGVGFLMQFSGGSGAENMDPQTVEEQLGVTDIQMTAAPVPPQDASAPAALPTPPQLVALETPAVPDLPVEEITPEFACDIVLTAEPLAAAMVELTLQADCLPNERVTVHHHGMMITDVTGSDGLLRLQVPALAEKSVFIASFSSGDGAVVQTNVPSLEFYDRVALQWSGSLGLELHALEFGAEYFSDGHVWADASRALDVAARGEGGFMTLLGNPDVLNPLMAQIYTFPSEISKKSGDVSVSVEAEVTLENCGKQVDAQTLEVRRQGPVRVQDVSLFMPNCNAVGDFLVLKNLLEDLKIAAR